MIAYVCKYAPVEVLESMGAEMTRLSPSVTNFNQADTLMHPNMCSFVKAALEEFSSGGYDGILLTTCCDSIRRLYDVLKEQYPDKFIYMIDVPRKVNEFSSGIFQKNIRKLAQAYAEYSGQEFSDEEFAGLLKKRVAASALRKAPEDKSGVRIGIVGTRCSQSILNLLEDHHVQVLFDMTCTGLERRLHFPKEAEIRGDKAEAVMSGYAWDLLNQVPCMRMVKASGRERFVEGYLDRIDGIICHTVKFCDMYAYEYTQLRETVDVPVLQIETDATKQSEGQMRTRVEAFIEAVGHPKKKIHHTGRGEGKMYVLGVDSGSTSTNAVILDENKKIVAFDVIRTGAKSGESAERVLKEVLQKAGLARSDIAAIVSTGYGRVSIPYADENVTEISCHGRGAHYLNPDVRTVLDIGGQDSKAIHINEEGEVTDFVMNDKCAAGTGRFLEAMARTLEVDVAELGPLSLQWKENIEITSMCTVFAESEVISLIARNKEISDIAHGIHNAIAGKAYSLIRRVSPEPVFMMTGGVAKNPGVVKALEEKLGGSLFISRQPEIVGALGAALFALENY